MFASIQEVPVNIPQFYLRLEDFRLLSFFAKKDGLTSFCVVGLNRPFEWTSGLSGAKRKFEIFA